MLASVMAGGFSRADVERIAVLADLGLDPTELELFARQLGDILAYADEIRQVDTTGVAPMAHVLARGRADRPDEVRPCLDRDDVLAAAPDPAIEAGLFKVPRVFG